MQAEVLLRTAVTNNARWCDAVCRSHGHPGEFTALTWLSPRHDLPFHPNAITLSPEATAADTQVTRAPGPGLCGQGQLCLPRPGVRGPGAALRR